jgi:hypothetical protein
MTAQASESLFYKGEELAMCSTPLDIFLANSGRDLRFQGRSTACWRGYIADWEVRGDRLYIIGISATLENGKNAILEDLFPGYPDGAFAHWFSGEVRCPVGRQIEYVHMGFASKFERDLFLKFKKGVLVSERIVENGKAAATAVQRYQPAAWINYPAKTLDNREDQ